MRERQPAQPGARAPRQTSPASYTLSYIACADTHNLQQSPAALSDRRQLPAESEWTQLSVCVHSWSKIVVNHPHCVGVGNALDESGQSWFAPGREGWPNPAPSNRHHRDCSDHTSCTVLARSMLASVETVESQTHPTGCTASKSNLQSSML